MPASRDEILLDYLDRLQFPPYPVQEEALYAWAACEQGVLLSAPTGTGKTLVAEAAVYEGLRTGKIVYYSTPLIALTDQKLLELQDTVAHWGYDRDHVGLVTGHRTVNPQAQIKVVVAEVLLNRLLHQGSGPGEFDFADVGAVVMDEFHNFNEPERGIVWELALSLLPLHVRVMLLSATVGAAHEFINWMNRSLDRRVTLVEGKERKVPLTFEFIGDELLPDFLERVAGGADTQRRTPALVFCFDREVCWSTAEVLRGKDVFAEGQRQPLLDRLEQFDFSVGAGNKLRPLLARGVGVHHAGLLPRYRRVVETLFQEKLLPICVCTETLAAGLNLPARSVVLTTLVKGPRDKKRIIDTGAAQQMFGRAGRPQFDTEGNVYAIAHEDEVKLAKWKEKYDSIPEDTKDPGLMKAKKQLMKKKPTRRAGFTYWNADQFLKLQTAPPAKLASKGNLSWRWLAFLLDAGISPSPGTPGEGRGEGAFERRTGVDVRNHPHPNPLPGYRERGPGGTPIEPIRTVIRKRLMDQPTIELELKRLTKMLVTLHQLGVVVLTPPPPKSWEDLVKPSGPAAAAEVEDESEEAPEPVATPSTRSPAAPRLTLGGDPALLAILKPGLKTGPPPPEPYDPVTAAPTAKLKQLMVFRAVHPLYGLYLLDFLAKADDAELIQILESVLAIPGSVAKAMRVPWPDRLPPGPLATEVVDPALLTQGLATQEDMYPPADQSDIEFELRKYPIPLAMKMKMLFENTIDHAGGLYVTPVWAVGDLLERGGKFDDFVRSRELVKQEGIVFKHLLRMILLCEEFKQLTPAGTTPPDWELRLRTIAEVLTTACREVDPQSTDEMLEETGEGDGVSTR